MKDLIKNMQNEYDELKERNMKLDKELKCVTQELENLKRTLSRITSAIHSGNSSNETVISANDFMRMYDADVINHFCNSEEGHNDLVMEFYDEPIYVTYKGFTAEFGNGAEWANFFGDILDEGVYQ